jgi:hypothetical protein
VLTKADSRVYVVTVGGNGTEVDGQELINTLHKMGFTPTEVEDDLSPNAQPFET